MIFAGHGVNTKVVDIDEIYLNMQNEQNPMSRFLAKSEKPRFLIKKSAYNFFWDFSREIRLCNFQALISL